MVAPRTERAFVAGGANLGDAAATLDAAFTAISAEPGLRIVARSALYRTAPVGCTGQPDFVNAVAALDCAFGPEALLERLLAIEERFGRRRSVRNAPRTLDLDLLLFDALELHTPRLVLPHPRMHQRAFVLIPLHEIAPDTVIPGHGPVAALLAQVADQRIERI